MKLDLTIFELFPADAVVTAENIDLNLGDSGIGEIESVVVRLAVQQSDQEYFCQGTIEARVIVECARCLTPLPMKIVEQTDFIVCPEGLHETGPDAPVDDEEYLYFKGKDPVVDMSPMVREALILGVGMKPTCPEGDPACVSRQQKLAEKIGIGSDEDRIDPRWEALRKLKESRSSNQ